MVSHEKAYPRGTKAMSWSSLYRCAVPTQCLSIGGFQNSPVCAVLASRDHLVVKLGKIGKEKYMDRREQYEKYCEDRSVQEIMEDELDSILERLMDDGGAADGRDPGRAESLCWAIALVENPYAPNMDAVKGKAMLRYEQRMRESEGNDCSWNAGGDPGNPGCEDEATGEDGLCDKHREVAGLLEQQYEDDIALTLIKDAGDGTEVETV